MNVEFVVLVGFHPWRDTVSYETNDIGADIILAFLIHLF